MGRIVSYGHLGILKRARLMRSFLESKGYKAVMGAHRKEAAVRAGLGAIGKNNLVLNPRYGSWVAYQSIITNAPLEADQPCVDDVCGKCGKCLKACPTAALYEPRRLDPRLCVTCLLTSRDVPAARWPAMSTYILGCDACQDACPRNENLPPKKGMECLLPDTMGIYPPLAMLLELDETRFQKQVIGAIQDKISNRPLLNCLMKSAAIRRLAAFLMKTLFKGKEILPETFVHASGNLEVYKRNALVAAGNLGDKSLVETVKPFTGDPYLGPYANWALKKLAS
jgi:epoxyqueuosine reductase QueG